MCLAHSSHVPGHPPAPVAPVSHYHQYLAAHTTPIVTWPYLAPPRPPGTQTAPGSLLWTAMWVRAAGERTEVLQQRRMLEHGTWDVSIARSLSEKYCKTDKNSSYTYIFGCQTYHQYIPHISVRTWTQLKLWMSWKIWYPCHPNTNDHYF